MSVWLVNWGIAEVGEAAATAVRLRLLACLRAAELGAMAV